MRKLCLFTISKSFIIIFPEVGNSNPQINLRIVVLPAPEGPINAIFSPLFTEKLILSRHFFLSDKKNLHFQTGVA